jgi:hypothetical protein
LVAVEGNSSDVTFLFSNESLFFGLSVIEQVEKGPWDPAGWRYLFSQHVEAAETFRSHCQLMNRLSRFENEPWLVVRNILFEMDTNPKSWAPIPGEMLQLMRLVMTGHLLQMAKVRLLRSWLTLEVSGCVEDVGDPFGGRLYFERSGSSVAFWSVGKDGVDNSGAGGWDDCEGADIVLKVPNP